MAPLFSSSGVYDCRRMRHNEDMTTTRKPRSEAEWAEYIESRKAAVRELKTALANGEDEVESAHRLGFATRRDVEAMILCRTGKRVSL